jgi:hypothetical protein
MLFEFLLIPGQAERPASTLARALGFAPASRQAKAQACGETVTCTH